MLAQTSLVIVDDNTSRAFSTSNGWMFSASRMASGSSAGCGSRREGAAYLPSFRLTFSGPLTDENAKVAVGFQFGEDDVARGEGRVPAQVHFDVGCEPAQLKFALGFDRISGFRTPLSAAMCSSWSSSNHSANGIITRHVSQKAFRNKGVTRKTGGEIGVHRSILSGAPHVACQHHRSGNHQQEGVGQDVSGLQSGNSEEGQRPKGLERWSISRTPWLRCREKSIPRPGRTQARAVPHGPLATAAGHEDVEGPTGEQGNGQPSK